MAARTLRTALLATLLVSCLGRLEDPLEADAEPSAEDPLPSCPPPEGESPADAGQHAPDASVAPPEPIDDAKIVAVTFPATLECGEPGNATVKVRNTGTSTWTRAEGFRLGANDDSDPIATVGGRVDLPEDVVISPGESYVFALPLAAPNTAGKVTSDWRMVHERVRWFGELGAADVDVSCKPANRTPDPAPGQALPLPNVLTVIQDVNRANPALIQQSCVHSGGNWAFMDAVVDRLRQIDTRWGYNGKRGNAADPSQDVIDYHYGPGPDEGSTDVYIIDIIGGHCGTNPSPTWNDVTSVTLQSGTIGRWTGRGRF